MKGTRFHFDNLADHGVAPFEAEEALYDGWRLRRRDGDNYEVLGRTGDGRYLQLVVTDLPDYIWVFHGREMKDREKQRYHRMRGQR